MTNFYVITVVLVGLTWPSFPAAEVNDLSERALLDMMSKYGGNSTAGLKFENFEELLSSINLSQGSDLPSPSCFNTTPLTDYWFKECWINKCWGAEQIFKFYELATYDVLSKKQLKDISPVLLQKLDSPKCLSKKAADERWSKPTKKQVWGYGFLSVTIISVGSLIGAFLLPVSQTKCYKYLLTWMVALAVGALSGTAIFGLIPEGFGISSVVEFSDYAYKSSVVLAGIFLFFITERSIKLALRAKQVKRKKPAQEFVAEDDWREHAQRLGSNGSQAVEKSESTAHFLPLEDKPSKNGTSDAMKKKCESSASNTSSHSHGLSDVGVVAWMIILGDGLHNFVDGLAIGAAFTDNLMTGLSVSVSILCEELPHELGDFAVLLRSGMSIKRALLFNFLSACLCYIGLVIGIIVGEMSSATPYVLLAAGGMFLYISLTDLLPEMNAEMEHASQDRGWPALRLLLLQTLGLFIGWTATMLLTLYGHNIEF